MNDKYLMYGMIFALGFLTRDFMQEQQVLGAIGGLFNWNK